MAFYGHHRGCTIGRTFLCLAVAPAATLTGALCLIIAGTIGNFIDRLQNGYVVDMFELLFINFPVFNLADCCLTVGVLWLLVIVVREED